MTDASPQSRPGVRLLVLRFAVALVALTACREDAPQKSLDHFFADVPGAPTDGTVSGDIVLHAGRRFGTAEGAAMLGRIGAVATTAQHLIVYDVTTCELVIFSRRDPANVERIGGCGDGPGDLRSVTTLHVHGDTLYVYGNRTLSMFDQTFRFVRSESLSDFATIRSTSMVQQILPLDDRTFFLVKETVGQFPGAITDTQALASPWHIGTVARGSQRAIAILALNDVANRTQVKRNFIRHVHTCVRSHGQSPRALDVYALSIFVPHLVGATYAASGSWVPIASIRLPFSSTFAPIPASDGQGELRSADGFASIACDDTQVIVGWRPGAGLDEPPAPAEMLRIRSRGRIERIRADLPENEFILGGRLVAVDHDTMFVSMNLHPDFPLIMEGIIGGRRP